MKKLLFLSIGVLFSPTSLLSAQTEEITRKNEDISQTER